MNFKDQVAVVTGGANGIGRAIALKLADQGAAVMIADTNKDAAIITAAEIEEISGNSAIQYVSDYYHLAIFDASKMRLNRVEN